MSAFFIHWLHPIPLLLGMRGAFLPLMDRIMEERGDQDQENIFIVGLTYKMK